MTNIAVLAGWNEEKSMKIALFQAELTSRMRTSWQRDGADVAIQSAINEIVTSSFTETDKQFMLVVFGVFLAKAGAYGGCP